MPREAYQRNLRELQDEVLVMGSMIEKALERSMQALKTRDLELAKQVIDEDSNVNKKRFEIEESLLDTMSCQSPMASDLRTLLAVLSIVTDLERMGDHAAGNAKIEALRFLVERDPAVVHAENAYGRRPSEVGGDLVLSRRLALARRGLVVGRDLAH